MNQDNGSFEQFSAVGAELTLSSESSKVRDFVSEPLGDKPVTAIAGIGKATSERMASLGINYAYQLVGIFLQHKKDRVLFRTHLSSSFGMNNNHLVATTNCIGSWVDSYC